MKRKSQKSLTKRILGGYFGVRDIGKIKKYQRNLGSVASGFEVQDLIASISCMWLTEKRIIRANQITSRSMKSYWEFLKVEHSVQLKMTIPSIWRNRPNLRGTKKGQLNSKPRLNVLRQIY